MFVLKTTFENFKNYAEYKINLQQERQLQLEKRINRLLEHLWLNEVHKPEQTVLVEKDTPECNKGMT